MERNSNSESVPGTELGDLTPGADPSPVSSDEPGLEQLVEDVEGKARSSSMAQVVAENFSVQEAIGGWRGLAESILPGLVFVIVYVITSNLTLSLILSSGVAVIATIVRLIQRTPVTQALAGLFGVAIGVAWAAWTGRAADYFAWGLILNIVYLVAVLVSIAARWPVVGIVVGIFRSQGTAWRRAPALMKIYDRASWLWVALFLIRTVVQIPMYQGNAVAELGIAKIIMGVPMWAATLWLTWLMVRKARLPDEDEKSDNTDQAVDQGRTQI